MVVLEVMMYCYMEYAHVKLYYYNMNNDYAFTPYKNGLPCIENT